MDLSELRAKWTKRALYIVVALAVPASAIAAAFNQVYSTLAIAIPVLLTTQALMLVSIDQLRTQMRQIDALQDVIRQFG